MEYLGFLPLTSLGMYAIYLGIRFLVRSLQEKWKKFCTCQHCQKPRHAKEERSFADREKLTCFEQQLFRELRCPDCGMKNLLEGPCGGLSQNIYCGTEECGSRFNEMGPFGIDRISQAQPKKRHAAPRGGYR